MASCVTHVEHYCVTTSGINAFECKGNYSATLNNNEVGTLAVDGWAITTGTARRGLSGAAVRPRPLAVPNVTVQPSTVSVLITVLLYNVPLLYGFKGVLQSKKMN